jgi:hypothetical protein
MKSKIIITMIILFVVNMVLFNACNKKKCNDPTDPTCENYDACYMQETSADFAIYARGVSDAYLYWRNSIEEIDTLYATQMFLATKQKIDSVKWKVGKEINYRFGDSNFVSFGMQRVGKIDITCIAYRKPNLSCFPNDDGIDTVTKSLFVAPFETIPVLGKFKGMFLNDPLNLDSFEIAFRTRIGETNCVMDSIDRNRGWADYNVTVLYVGKRFYYFGSGMTGFPKDTGYFPFGEYNKGNNTLMLKFKGYRSIEDPEKDRIWVGRKL